MSLGKAQKEFTRDIRALILELLEGAKIEDDPSGSK